jgi:hypothetical protein
MTRDDTGMTTLDFTTPVRTRDVALRAGDDENENDDNDYDTAKKNSGKSSKSNGGMGKSNDAVKLTKRFKLDEGTNT